MNYCLLLLFLFNTLFCSNNTTTANYTPWSPDALYNFTFDKNNAQYFNAFRSKYKFVDFSEKLDTNSSIKMNHILREVEYNGLIGIYCIIQSVEQKYKENFTLFLDEFSERVYTNNKELKEKGFVVVFALQDNLMNITFGEKGKTLFNKTTNTLYLFGKTRFYFKTRRYFEGFSKVLINVNMKVFQSDPRNKNPSEMTRRELIQKYYFNDIVTVSILVTVFIILCVHNRQLQKAEKLKKEKEGRKKKNEEERKKAEEEIKKEIEENKEKEKQKERERIKQEEEERLLHNK